MATYVNFESKYPRLLKFDYHYDNYSSTKLCIVNNEEEFDLACYNFFHDTIHGIKTDIKKEDQYFNSIIAEGKPCLTKKQLAKIAPKYILHFVQEAIARYDAAKNYQTRPQYLLLQEAVQLDAKKFYHGCGRDIVNLLIKMNKTSITIEQLITSEHLLLCKPAYVK